MAHYRFETRFQVRAALDDVHAIVIDPRPWARGLGDVVALEREREGDQHGVGGVLRAAVRAPLGYTLAARIETTAVARDRIEVRVTGDLDGDGVWDLTDDGGITTAVFTWDVETQRRWMELLEPVARPLFVRSHGLVMRRACRAAADHLGHPLAAFETGVERNPGRPS